MILYSADDVSLEWLDLFVLRLSPDCHVDGERVQTYRQELRLAPDGHLDPVLVVDGVVEDGNHRVAACFYEGRTKVLAVVVRRRAKGE